jgi:NTE family protein
VAGQQQGNHFPQEWHLICEKDARVPGDPMWGLRLRVLGQILRSVRTFGRELSRRQIIAPTSSPSQKIGIALGGGFARGIAHIGVLKVLEEENVPISFVAGTSVGALIGAIYCSGASAAEMEEIACRVRFRDFARWTISRYGFASNRRMAGLLNSVLKVKTFEELRIPLAVTATDFASGAGVIFQSGQLVETVRASCAYPGMFEPIRIEDKVLVDGMLAHPVPTKPLREMGADHVLAIHLKGRWDVGGAPRHLFDVIGQCFAIAQENSAALWRPWADILVEPEVKDFKYDDFEHSCDLIRAGEAAMRAALPEVRAWLNLPSPTITMPSRPAMANPAAVPAD